MPKNKSKLLILKDAFLATFCSFYFTFISLFILEWIFGKNEYPFDYWSGNYWGAIGCCAARALLALIFFSFHFILLIAGFYFGIKNLRKGDKKKIFIWPIIILGTSIIFPGLLVPPFPEVYQVILQFSVFWHGLLALLFFILITSSAFYFQKERHLLKAVGISFLILVFFIPPTKYFYEKKQEEFVKKGEEILTRVKSLKEKAIKTGDPKLCEKIKEINETLDPRIKYSWKALKGDSFPLRPISERDDCIKNIAIKKKDTRMCKEIWNDDERIICEREIKLFTEEVLAPCRNLLTSEEKDYCIKKIALETNNIELCGLISGYPFESPKKSCFKEIILRGKRSEARSCKKISSELVRNACFFEVAVNKNDLEMCKYPGWYQKYCYTGIAIKRKDPKICKKITDKFYQSECIIDVAVFTNNLDICNEELKGYNQKKCISRVLDLQE